MVELKYDVKCAIGSASRNRGGGEAGRAIAHHFFPWVDFFRLQITSIMYKFHHLIAKQ